MIRTSVRLEVVLKCLDMENNQQMEDGMKNDLKSIFVLRSVKEKIYKASVT